MPDTHESLFPGLSLRQPPMNLEAEAALLGALLHANGAREKCGDLRPEHFASEDHARVYRRILERMDESRTVTAVSLKSEFDNGLLAGLLASMVGIINVPEYARTIRECAERREFIEIGEGLISQAFAGDPVADTATNASGRLDAIMTGSASPRSVSLGDAMTGAVQAMDDAKGRSGPTGVSAGFRKIDERVGGLEPGTLTVLAGRPGMGKSALGWQIALNAARAGHRVLAISLEMSAIELGRRALAAAARVPITAMKYGRVTQEQTDRIIGARREMYDLPLMIEDSAGLTAGIIAARTKAFRRKGLGLVMIDHLHIVRPDDADARQGATWAVGRISGAMKRLAKDCEVPVLLLAQLNRGVEGRDDKRPGLGDLRQAGDIEQDADAVGFVYRPEYYLGNTPERKTGESDAIYSARITEWEFAKASVAGKADIIWAKIRDGESGTDSLLFHGPTTSFSERENG